MSDLPSPGPVLGTLFTLPGEPERPAPAADLPSPSRERFQPLRAGILNLWQYDEQELCFHDGRLILRGENGSGKSKALEVLLPFLLDADLSPQRLDPFGGTSRTMEWNLLQDGRYESRIGYVWLELGRREEEPADPAAGEHFWTLGCGLRATAKNRKVEPWYFLTRRRVGRDLFLSPGQTALLKDQLRQQLGDEGWVFDSAREYRERLDAHLFGLGEDRFAILRHLLLQLRRPHLSEKLDPQTLSDLLKESLPPLDPDLIGQLSESFERLDKDQSELVRTEAAAASVASFLELYQEYGRGVARGRAAEVRQADSRYHKTAGEVRDEEAEHLRLTASLEELQRREAEVRAAAGAAQGQIAALERSPEMRSAQELKLKRQQAEGLFRQAQRDEADRDREGQNLEERRRDWSDAAGEVRRAAGRREEELRSALAAAREAGLEAVAEAAAEALPGPAALATVQAAVRRGEEGIAELRRLARETEQARNREERSQERRREADTQLRSAVERGQAARQEAERQAEALEAALVSWWQGLAELRLGEAEIERLRGVVAAEDGGPGGLVAAVHELMVPQRDAWVAARAGFEREAAGVQELRRETAEERERVAAVRELGPEPPRTRGADRAGRPGAPLYLLCEFADGLGEAEKGGLEAALEAAGLLDAWVTPEGGVLPPGTLDSFLVAPATGRGGAEAPAAPPPRGTLGDVLVAAPGHGVGREVIEAVLGSVALLGPGSEPGAEGAGLPAVGPGGAFRLGPLHGAWEKAGAEHVGAGAREAARRRRLAELARRLEELDHQLASLDARRQNVDARLARLDREVEAVPATAELLRARLQAAEAGRDESRRRAELEEAARAADRARAEREGHERRFETRAGELGLAAYRNDLDSYRDRLHGFQTAFRELARAAEDLRRGEGGLERAQERFQQAQARDEEARRRARESAAAAQTARAEHEALEALVGVAAREIVERLQDATRRLAELESARAGLEEEILGVREARVRAETRLQLLRNDLEERDAARGQAVGRLRHLVEARFLPLVLDGPAGAADAAGEAGPWSLTRALDLAREIERASAGVELGEEAMNRRANRLHQRYSTVAADLGGDYQPSLDAEGDLYVIRVGFNGRDHDVPGLLAVLRENIAVRRELLADFERETMQRFLLGEVGTHLRHRLLQAQSHVDRMNDLLMSCQTASGMSLRLAWEPLPEAAAEVRDAVRLLRQDHALLADADRRRLESFFLRRISDAREQWDVVPWREHLLHSLDYRAWYRFRIQRRTGERREWEDLTRRGHAASSGGEKAVALHLPLFAAAAAHYHTARDTAPRLILLDEAFAGIDQGMRGRCMGLLVGFDLDFMMTSHEEWGCYQELPGVATYQLYRDPAVEGVAAVRFVWDGRRLQEEPAGEAPGPAAG